MDKPRTRMVVVRAFDTCGLVADSVAGIFFVILSPEIRMGVWKRYRFIASEATIILVESCPK